MNNNQIKSFAKNGHEKMIYDTRMGPQALLHKNKIYICYQANPSGKEPQPWIIYFDINEKSFSKPVQVAKLPEKEDHHHAPIMWFDEMDKIHIYCYCHSNKGDGLHLVSKNPLDINKWEKTTRPAKRITYPRLFRLSEKKLLMYLRVKGHLGYWAYIISEDNGYTWTDPVPLFDFDKNPGSELDEWAGSYHSIVLDSEKEKAQIGFVYWDESRSENPLYKKEKTFNNYYRYHLYGAELDIKSNTLFNLKGQKMSTPVNKEDAEKCKIWDTGHKWTNQPTVLFGEKPAFMIPVAGESAYQVLFYFVFLDNEGVWKKVQVTETNNIWSASALTRDEEGNIVAYLVSEKQSDKKLKFGGGDRIEQWISSDGGFNWKKENILKPEPGLVYNNPTFVEKKEGEILNDYLIFFGWKGNQAICNDGKAFLWQKEGK